MESQILETANRLRLIQVDFADESEQTRTAYLREEIEKVLKTVLPAERNEFLERLLERFPAGSFVTQTISKEVDVQSAPVVDESQFKNVDFLVGSLLEIAPALSDDQKDYIDQSLRQAGLGPKAQQSDSVGLDQKLKEKLKLENERSINAARLAELNAMLVDFVLKLEPLVWNTWRKLSPRSTVRPQGALTQKIGQILCEDTEMSVNQVDDDLKVLQRLIASMTSAVSCVGGQFAKRHIAKFSPSEIEALVRMEPGSVFVSRDVKCWNKYKQLAETLNEDSIEMEIRKAIVDYVESLAKGMGQ
ncbi:MAG TPA: hypothetical protein DIU00_01960 [Phycisphaerales bacterium]|nr:hypothetical protein [Phycisphaerales bacterium]